MGSISIHSSARDIDAKALTESILSSSPELSVVFAEGPACDRFTLSMHDKMDNIVGVCSRKAALGRKQTDYHASENLMLHQ